VHTRNLRLCNGSITVLKITLPHSISVITNFVIPKRDKRTNKLEIEGNAIPWAFFLPN